MADIFNIAGEINSTSQEGTAVHANQVKDDLKNKKQSQINEAVGEELELHTNRLNALTDENFVTVQATQSTTAADIPTLINASGEGEQTDTIYRVGFWDGSAFDGTKYSEYAWNGSAYVQLNVRTALGEIFDISEYNASGGSPATYANLTAALAGVPLDAKHGGMTVKFIQRTGSGTTEDPYVDTYVQYRYMGTATTGNPNPFLDVANWQGLDEKPTLESRNLVESGGVQNELALGAVYDVSAHNNNATFESLSALLSNANLNTLIPSAVRKGGMSIKFAQSSDNKYMSFRYMGTTIDVADFANPDNWSFCGDDVIVENPEYIKVSTDSEGKILEAIKTDGTKVVNVGAEVHGDISTDGADVKVIDSPEFIDVKIDSEGRILWGIQKDGNVMFGAGVPKQVVDYITKKIEELSLDEYEDIVRFLNGLEDGSSTLPELLNGKVDKVENKGLSTNDFTDSEKEAVDMYSVVENPEYISVTTDQDKKIIEGIKGDGTKQINIPISIKDTVDAPSFTIETINNPEYISAEVDASGKILSGTKYNGSHYIHNVQSETIDAKVDKEADKSLIDSNVAKSVSYIESPEYINVEADSEGKILEATTAENKKIINKNVEINGSLSTDTLSIDETSIKNTEDPEERSEIKTDSEGRIISFRDKDGVLHENVGIKLPLSSLEDTYEFSLNHYTPKNWYLPKFGKVNIKEETFYLTKDSGYSDKSGVVLIQILEDNGAHALHRDTISYFYVLDSTLTGAGSDGNSYTGDLVTRVGEKYYVTTSLDGGSVTDESIEVTFSASSVSGSSTQLELHAGKDVAKIGNSYFATAIWVPYEWTDNGVLTTGYNKVKAQKVLDPETGDVIGYTYNGESTEVTKITDIPPYKAWKIHKKPEHYCVADIDFGDYYKKDNVAVSIKYQGSGSTKQRKKSLRLTFYKNNSYAKKDKVKIGEMVRLSGYNVKAYALTPDRLNDPIISALLIEMWETRGKECYPWNKDNVPYNGATGFIKSFPCELWWDTEFYGLDYFGLKKDEKNYMLDDDASGIFVSENNAPYTGVLSPRYWADELGDDDRELAYPDYEDSVSVETAAAMTEFFKYIQGFIDGTTYKGTDNNIYLLSELTDVSGTYYVTSTLEDGQVVQDSVSAVEIDFENSMLEERLDIANAIDYWIAMEVFVLYDSVYNNMVLYTGSDKKKFYMFFYDLDGSLRKTQGGSIVLPSTKFMDICEDVYGMNMDFWEKFTDEYKDSIINRFAELRNSVLSDKNINDVFHSYIDGIPDSAVNMELARWGSGNPRNFINEIKMVQDRLSYLYQNYINL